MPFPPFASAAAAAGAAGAGVPRRGALLLAARAAATAGVRAAGPAAGVRAAGPAAGPTERAVPRFWALLRHSTHSAPTVPTVRAVPRFWALLRHSTHSAPTVPAASIRTATAEPAAEPAAARPLPQEARDWGEDIPASPRA